MTKMKKFPEFWFEGNLYFGWIKNLSDLKKVFVAYKGHLTKNEILDKSLEYSGSVPKNNNEFGLRIEHKGNTTLRQFLKNNGIEI
jgi:hypothetical protein